MSKIETLRARIDLLMSYDLLQKTESVGLNSFVAFWELEGLMCNTNYVFIPVYHQYHVKDLTKDVQDKILGLKVGETGHGIQIEACFDPGNGELWKVPPKVWTQIWGLA